MRDDDDDGFVLAHDADGARQRILAVGIQIGVGLVEHEQERVAEHRPRQADALLLAGRQRHAALPDSRRIAFRQAQNDVVDTGDLRGLQDRIRTRVIVEAADVLRHGAVEQADILRQIADVPAEILVAPLIERRAVEPHGAAMRRPDSNQRLRERGLARRARAEQRQPRAGLERKRDTGHDRHVEARRGDREILHGQFAAGARQLDRRRRWRRGRLADVAQTREALAGGGQLLPGAERDFDGRERAPHQDRGRDHDAARRLVGDDEIGAHAQHSRLQDVAQHLRARAEIGIDVGGADVFLQVPLVGLRPARRQAIRHAERAERFPRCAASHPPAPAAARSGPIAVLVAPREIRSVTNVMAMIAAVPSSAVKPIIG